MERSIEAKPKLVMENIKANIFSTVFLIVLGALLLLTYYLLKDYITVLCFAFISAIAIKPTKDYILHSIILGNKDRFKKNFIGENYLVKLFTGLYRLVTDFKNNYMKVWELVISVWNSVKHFRTDIYSLLILTLAYILVFKIGITLSSVVISSLLLFDLVIRFVIFTYRRIFVGKVSEEIPEIAAILHVEQECPPSPNIHKKGKKSLGKNNNSQQQVNIEGTTTTASGENEEEREKRLKAEKEDEIFYNSLVSTLCVVGFVTTIVFILVSFGGLCLYDIIDMRNKVSKTLQVSVKEVNNLIEQQGIKSYLDEAFIKDQILGQVDKLDTYITQSNLLPAIQVFQGVVNNYFNNTNSAMEEQEATYTFRLKIEECQKGYISYLNVSYIPDFIINSANEVTAVVCYMQIFINQMDFNINEILNNVKNVGGNLYQNVQKMIVWIFQSIFTFLFSIIDYFLQTIIYLTSLFYLLSSPQFTLSKLLLLLPLEGEIKKKLENSLEKNIRGVFASTLKISFYHIILTWLMLDIFDLPFSFITSILAGVIAILPIVPVYCITIPYCVYLYYQGCIIEMIILFVGYLHISLLSIDAIYSKNIAVHPFITGICVAMGMSVFDLKGIIIGPLIVCSVYLLVDVLGQIQETKKIEPQTKKITLKKLGSVQTPTQIKSSNSLIVTEADPNNENGDTPNQPIIASEVKNTAVTEKQTANTQQKQKRKESEKIDTPAQKALNNQNGTKSLAQPNDDSITKRNTRSQSKKNNQN